MPKLLLAAFVFAALLLDAGFGCGGPSRPAPDDANTQDSAP